MVLLDISGGAGMVFFVMRGLIGSFSLITQGGPFFAFEGVFIVFFVLRALGGPLATPRCPQRAFRGSSGDPWVPLRCFLGLGFDSLGKLFCDF